MRSDDNDPHRALRDAVRALCAEFPVEYFRKVKELLKDDGVMATAREHHAKAVKTEEQRLNQPKAPLQIDFYDSGSESLFENTNK